MPPRSPKRRVPPRTAFVILEYCGGARTDALHARIAAANPSHSILVLDNASPTNPASCVTHQNKVNSYVGGGIRDCLALAESLGARYLFYCVNDVTLCDPLVIEDFQKVMDVDPSVAAISCALSSDSVQVRRFGWLAQTPGGGLRRLRAIDLIACLIRLDFVRSFGGFPESRGGWGYMTELAHHARKQGLKLLVNDGCAVRHMSGRTALVTKDNQRICKGHESEEVYGRRYGSLAKIRGALGPPPFDETRAYRPAARIRRARRSAT